MRIADAPLVAVVIIAFSVVLSVLHGGAAFADNRGPYNNAEANARAQCVTDRRGAIWFTNSGDYYSDSVSVTDGQDLVTVGIRGSVYNCAQSATANTGAYNVTPTDVNGWRLGGLSATEFNRGTASGRYNWSSVGGQITATLNVSGLATNNLGRTDSQTIQVGLYRCFVNYTTGYRATGAPGCYTEYISVTVIRQPKPIQWSLSGSSTVRVGSGAASTSVSAKPGDRLTWTHQIRNNGRDATNINVYSNLGMSGLPNNATGFPAAAGAYVSGAGGANIGAGSGVGVIRSSWPSNVTAYTVDQKDVGNTLCQWVQYDPTNTSGGRNGRGNQACASVPYNYGLAPSVTLNKGRVEAGTEVTVSGSVRNNGPTKSRSTTWQFSYITIAPSGTTITSLPGATGSGADPCGVYAPTNSGRTCRTGSGFSYKSGSGATSGTQVFDAGTTPFSGVMSLDLPVGTIVCYGLSVRSESSGSSAWSHSTAPCVVISKSPLAQVIGGDLIVGRGAASTSIVSTKTKTLGATTYGSWVEYGIASSGLVTGIASAAGYEGGVTATNYCKVSYLSFGNMANSRVCADSSVGGYAFKAAASSIANRFPVSSAQQIPTSEASRTTGQFSRGGVYTTTLEAFTFDGGGVEAGKWFVINAPNTTITISNNVTYTSDPLGSIASIPQVVIIARNIVVDQSVTNIDAWLVATGTGTEGKINTCGAGSPRAGVVITETSAVNSTVCDKGLRVNGPASANHLILRRTYGADNGSTSGVPAEIFNLRPDAYLWAASLQQGTVKAQTVMSTELPPRY